MQGRLNVSPPPSDPPPAGPSFLVRTLWLMVAFMRRRQPLAGGGLMGGEVVGAQDAEASARAETVGDESKLQRRFDPSGGTIGARIPVTRL